MARKSRKASHREIEVVAGPEFCQTPTAIYARLSVENSGKDDNGSAIETQVDVCRDYLKDFPELKLMDTYIDNGYTGTVFSRPQFNRLMEDVRTGKIRAIVVRDLSRFGRNYIEDRHLPGEDLSEAGCPVYRSQRAVRFFFAGWKQRIFDDSAAEYDQ